MKSIYKCDICSKEFKAWQECNDHETLCKERHATGIRLAEELNYAIRTAEESGSVAVAAVFGFEHQSYTLKEATYDAETKKVIIKMEEC